MYGSKCDKCFRHFSKDDYVMRAKNKIFHMNCFRCAACEKQLVPGDEFALKHDELFCKEDSGSAATLMKSGVKEGLENNNNNIMQHNTSNSSEDNSEGRKRNH